MGLLPPIGLLDLLEFAKNGSKEIVWQSRAAWIKLGRVSLHACPDSFMQE